MNESEQSVIVCVPWGRQRLASVERTCMECGRKVALDKSNVARSIEMKADFICMHCFARRKEPGVMSGGLVGGELVSLEEGLEIARRMLVKEAVQ